MLQKPKRKKEDERMREKNYKQKIEMKNGKRKKTGNTENKELFKERKKLREEGKMRHNIKEISKETKEKKSIEGKEKKTKEGKHK